MTPLMPQNRPARPAFPASGHRTPRKGQHLIAQGCALGSAPHKRNCALQGQNHETCPEGAALAGRRCVVVLPHPGCCPGLGDAAPVGRLCIPSAHRDACRAQRSKNYKLLTIHSQLSTLPSTHRDAFEAKRRKNYQFSILNYQLSTIGIFPLQFRENPFGGIRIRCIFAT